jgi:hypothetical protein
MSSPVVQGSRVRADKRGMLRIAVLATAHAALAAYFALMAQQWLSVSSGRVGLLTLFTPANDILGQGWAAAAAGAILGPALHGLLRHSMSRVKRRRLLALASGVGYALAVMLLTIVIRIPWTMVAGRGPGESAASALASSVFVILLGTPLFMVTSVLLFAPVLLLGGAAIGMAVLTVERNML